MALISLKVFTVMSASGVLWNIVFHIQQAVEQFLSLEEGHDGRGFCTLKCLFPRK